MGNLWEAREDRVCGLKSLTIFLKSLDFVLGTMGDSFEGFPGSVLRCLYISFRMAIAGRMDRRGGWIGARGAH